MEHAQCIFVTWRQAGATPGQQRTHHAI